MIKRGFMFQICAKWSFEKQFLTFSDFFTRRHRTLWPFTRCRWNPSWRRRGCRSRPPPRWSRWPTWPPPRWSTLPAGVLRSAKIKWNLKRLPSDLQITEQNPEIWKAIFLQAFQYPTNSLSIVTSGGKKTAQVKDKFFFGMLQKTSMDPASSTGNTNYPIGMYCLIHPWGWITWNIPGDGLMTKVINLCWSSTYSSVFLHHEKSWTVK